MIEFLIKYGTLIIDCVALIVAVVFFLIKKRPIKFVDSLKQIITEWLPGIIVAAEKTTYKGTDKLNFVVNTLYDLVVKDYLSYEDYLAKYQKFIVSQIEAILSTPQKKGENYER